MSHKMREFHSAYYALVNSNPWANPIIIPDTHISSLGVGINATVVKVVKTNQKEDGERAITLL